MIDHVWTVLCSRAVIDRTSNNVSLENVLERVRIEGQREPDTMLPMPLDVMTLWTRALPDEPCQGRMRLETLLPSGKKFGEFTGVVNLQNTMNYRSLVHLPGLPLAEAGRYLFVVYLQQPDATEWTQVATIPLSVVIEPPKDN
jgi:hypothetical protein